MPSPGRRRGPAAGGRVPQWFLVQLGSSLQFLRWQLPVAVVLSTYSPNLSSGAGSGKGACCS